jgi:hypothetical protein
LGNQIMRRPPRLIASAVLIALSGALAGCGSTAGFDPSDLLDFLDTKKKLPGDRKAVFPEGVPGLEQGVPKDLYRGARQDQDPNAQAVAVAPPEEPKSKRGTKSKGRQAAAPVDATGEAPPEEDGSTAAAPPAPKPAKIVRKRTTAPPPDQSAAQPAQQAPQQQASPFPAPMPSGSFTR